jgi:cytidine deaminase
VAAARAARRRAYAPYSRFQVGAALSAGGAAYSGCNVENVSYGLTVCAERNAVGAMVAAGARRLDAVVVASGTVPPTPPCGACLQVLREFGGAGLPVLLVGARGARVETTLGALLPQAFTSLHGAAPSPARRSPAGPHPAAAEPSPLSR